MSLQEVASLVWLQLNPNGTDEATVTLEEYITSAQVEAAYHLWVKLMAEKREEGYYDIPSYLMTEVEVDVKNNEANLCHLDIQKALPKSQWIINVGGLNCECKYVATTLNLAKALCDDEDRGHNYKTYYPQGQVIKFPQGAHKEKIKIIYANAGENMSGDIEIPDDIAAIVRTRLLEIYGGRPQIVDVVNNSNPNP